MSYQEGSNWQARKEDEGKPLYDNEPKKHIESPLDALRTIDLMLDQIGEGYSIKQIEEYVTKSLLNHITDPPSPPPQTGEKDEAYEVEHEEYVKGLIEETHELKIANDNLRKAYDDLARKLQPPAAQSDQEAAEKWADESIDPWRSSQETFLAGCTHVRGQQPVDAVALQKEIENGIRSRCRGLDDAYWMSEEDVTELAKDIVKELPTLYALFTARDPTPKPGSHDTEGKEGPGC